MGCSSWPRRVGRACSWWCRRDSPRCSRGSEQDRTSRLASPWPGGGRGARRAHRVLRQHARAPDGCVGRSEFPRAARAGAGWDLDAYAHQDVPFEQWSRRSQPVRSFARHPLFQMMLVFQNAPGRGLVLPRLRVASEAAAVERGEVRPDAIFVSAQGQAARPGLEGDLEFAMERFERDTAEELVAAALSASSRRGSGGRRCRRPAGGTGAGGAAQPARGVQRHGPSRCGRRSCPRCSRRRWRARRRRWPSSRGGAADLRGAQRARQPAGASPASLTG